MELSDGNDCGIRLLGLGNELLGDDALGPIVADQVRRRFGPSVNVVTSAASGFYLLDDIIGANRLIVVDTIVSRAAPAGSIRVLAGDEMRPAPGGSPHFVGLFEVLATGKALGLPVPEHVTIIAVEASDCLTIGARMHAGVEAAIPEVVNMIGRML